MVDLLRFKKLVLILSGVVATINETEGILFFKE